MGGTGGMVSICLVQPGVTHAGSHVRVCGHRGAWCSRSVHLSSRKTEENEGIPAVPNDSERGRHADRRRADRELPRWC